MYKVLIVDDDSIICAGLQKLINWEEYDFIADDSALNGAEALKMMEKNHYDLIITDIRMPKMDGIEFIKAFQDKGFSPETIILSGYRDFEYAQTALELGVKKYILKPVNEKKFIDAIISVRNEINQKHRHKQTMNESRMILKERAILDLLKEGEESLLAYKRLMDLGMDLDNKAFRVCVLELLDKGRRGSNPSYFIIKKAFQEFADRNAAGYAAQIDDSRIAVLICLAAEAVPASGYKADGIFQLLERYAGCTAKIAVGNEVPAYTRIFESYNNACALLEGGGINEQHRIMYFDEMENQKGLNEAVKYVKEHCCEKLSLQFIANKFFFNPAYLGRIFKSYTGLSFNDFLTDCKIEQAVKLLESRKFKISEIADKVGYADVDYFCRMFKTKKGCTPTEYRTGIK